MTDTTDTTPGFVTATRTFYDAVAEDYAEQFRDGITAKPLDRAVLTAYAELVGPGRRVADLGCGPGRTTGFLAALGLEMSGLDLSEPMLAIARRENPGIPFAQGSMLDLDLPDGALAGVVSYYSSIHTPVEELPALFTEFHRVLAPGGHLLLGFQVGDEPRHYDRPWGRPVAIDFERRRPERMAALLTAAGFAMVSRTVREPDTDGGEAVPQALLIARRPAGPHA
ncbi:class I SAM-dependent methyltransferase [Streptomyces asoensis]|uniref:class I SAM-dependent methyltransferase n=1 Tax=Streptomyces TaxID=1883 RepID=UPI00190B790A|nr:MULTISPECIES: class I SAM-dependent methyltransferase [unclassified Streptomyces]MBK3625763.1 methyltransferase domain-containing protein [Streptomyces sp. MBT49]MBK3632699.1 methyltransferase domain-containing protein [Streptomyces sp. MBT97]